MPDMTEQLDETARELGVEDVPKPIDPDAPFGRFSNGKPRKMPAGSRIRGNSPSAPAAKSKPNTKSKNATNYLVASQGLVQLIGMGLGMAGAATHSEALAADAATLVVHGQALAEGMATVADADPRFARVLDAVTRVGPYGALLTPAVAILTQIAANHRMVPAGSMGTASRDQLFEAVNPQTEQPAQRSADPRGGSVFSSAA